MEKQKNIPQLRFLEFDGDWEKKKLGSIANVTAGGTPSTFISEYWNGTIRWMNSGELNLKRVYEVENRITEQGLKNSSTKLIPKYSVLIGLAGQGKTRGTVAINMVELCTNQSIASVYPNETYFNSDFLYHNLDKRYDELRILSTGEGGRGGLNLQIIKFLDVFLPTLPEQQKIASFFTAIDEKITQLKQKKTLLELYKKGVMQKIFSQEIRFKDNNGQEYPKWERKKLGEFLVKHEEKTTENNQYPVLTSARTGIYFQKDYFDGNDVASKDNTGYNVVPRSFFTYRHMSDDLIFRFNINTICERGIVSTLYPVFTTINLNDAFLQIILNEGKEFRRYAIEQKQGGSRTYMYFSKLIELILRIPCIEEQTKIANFLSSIDDKINNTQKKMEKAEVWKKGLMQQMIV